MKTKKSKKKKPIKRRLVTITYRLDGEQKTWTIGCAATDTEDTVMAHLYKYIPQATFVSAIFEDV